MTHFISDVAPVTCLRGDPRLCYASWREGLGPADGLLLVDFELRQYWLQGAQPLPLTALYWVSQGSCRVAVTDQVLTADRVPPAEQYRRWVARHRLLDASPSSPLELLPRKIPKPWGHEIWYSAVESRGVSDFGIAGSATPIPWLQAVLPDDSAGRAGQALLLLKILDPAHEPVAGDLYFELHEEKRELYVVTGIDRGAWPDGVGYIRCGFDATRISRSGSEAAFRSSFLHAVQNYESARRTLDTLPQGVQPTPQQRATEQRLREEMNSFTTLQPLRVGDVIEIPLLVPHSLQHGVKVIEFQTPTYERKILYASQQVQTQKNWDTAAAVRQMRLDCPGAEPSTCLYDSAGVRLERIGQFPDFEVRRVSIDAAHSWQTATGATYAVLIVVSGELGLAGAVYRPEQAILLPANWAGELVSLQAAQPVVLLLALPCS